MSDYAIPIRDTFRAMVKHLQRGGTHGYWWTLDEKETFFNKKTGEYEPVKKCYCWPSETPGPMPRGETEHKYFGVHPISERREPWQRARNVDVMAINCLFAEFDQPCESLTPEPSIVIQSSIGKFHCYWLLRDTVMLDTDERRREVAQIQRYWVRRVGADEVKDLARVLRVPGTKNVKAKYAPDFPTVYFVKADLNLQYSFGELAYLVAPAIAEDDRAKLETALLAKLARPLRDTDPESSIITQYNQAHDIHSALSRAGYTSAGARYCAPSADRGIPASVVIIDDQYSYHWDTSDELADEHRHTAFDVFCHYEHKNDAAAAVKAAASELGLSYTEEQRKEYGRKLLAVEPHYDSEAFACCNLCNTRLEAATNGNGFVCRSGKHEALFWWQGDGYEIPLSSRKTAPSSLVVDDTQVISLADLVAEGAVLSCILQDTYSIVEVQEWLLPDYMSSERNRLIYTAALTVYRDRKITDLTNVQSELLRTQTLDKIGGLAALNDLYNQQANVDEIVSYARTVERYAILRRGEKAADKIKSLAGTWRDDADAFVAQASTILSDATTRIDDAAILPLSSIADEWLRVVTTESPRGVPTGFTDLDHKTKGIQPKELWVFAAPSGIGKTTLLQQIMLNVAEHDRDQHSHSTNGVMFFSIEMAKETLMNRFVAQYTGLELEVIRERRFSTDQIAQLEAAVRHFKTLPLYVDESRQTAQSIRSRVLRHISRYGKPTLIVVDYLQMMDVPGGLNKSYTKANEVSYTVKALRDVAKEAGTNIMCISALSNDLKLKESGDIEYTADNVIYMLRDKEAKGPDAGLTTLKFTKGRHCGEGEIKLMFDPYSATYKNHTTYKSMAGY